MALEWPESKSFATSFACKTLPKSGYSRFYSALTGPISNLFPIPGQLTVFVLSWLYLYVWYFLYSDQVPINKLNSTDGQYVDLKLCMASAFATYYLTIFFLIFLTYEKGCKIWTDQASEYLYSSPSFFPSTLASSAWPVDESEA
jgi:hypothetical protein